MKSRPAIHLVLLTFLTLYLELAIIRFASAQVLYLGYFANYILISVFLGIGLGFLSSNKKIDLFAFLPQILLFFLAFILITKIDVTLLRQTESRIYFGNNFSNLTLPIWLCLPLLFITSTFIFASISQETARLFSHFAPLTAYSLDIVGSLLGIIAFTFHSYMGGTPLQWFSIACILICLLSKRFSLFNALSMSLAIIILLVASAPAHYTRWSPYQKIEVTPMRGGYHLLANGIGHQTMHPPGSKEGFYDFPYLNIKKLHKGKPYENVLIIGSGSGTDVAYALANGVAKIDAVEIDPEIMKAGKKFHPSAPYKNPKVTVHITDGRAFMEKCQKRYDLIIFALPDSLALYSTYSSVRLESFLFTVESFTQAKKLLKDDGVLVLYNYFREHWLVSRLAAMLDKVFGKPPLVATYGSMRCAFGIGKNIHGFSKPPPQHLASDNWPFLYMKKPHLPLVYGAIMLFFVVATFIGVLLTGQKNFRSIATDAPFFFMGAAFLLLETRSIIQFTLLFGATWLVNSLVFFAILLSVLLANWLVVRLSFKNPYWLFALLFISLLVNYLLPVSIFLSIASVSLRYILASLVFFSPIFFSNLVFGYLFKDTKQSQTAFGWNIIGAMIGGACEYSSLVLGYNNLIIVIAALYALCVWTVLRQKNHKKS